MSLAAEPNVDDCALGTALLVELQSRWTPMMPIKSESDACPCRIAYLPAPVEGTQVSTRIPPLFAAELTVA
jgi:hypothetical protein